MSALKDLTGQRFGRLVVVERAENNMHRKKCWKCRCDCGSEHVIEESSLRSGATKSCGCIRVESLINRSTVHGKAKSRLYNVWKDMKRRCTNPNDCAYKRYGGRGINICNEWLHEFQAFYDWAMANGYDENAPKGQCTIDRIDNDKGYSPDNCRWVDMKTQRHNRSDSRSK